MRKYCSKESSEIVKWANTRKPSVHRVFRLVHGAFPLPGGGKERVQCGFPDGQPELCTHGCHGEKHTGFTLLPCGDFCPMWPTLCCLAQDRDWTPKIKEQEKRWKWG